MGKNTVFGVKKDLKSITWEQRKISDLLEERNEQAPESEEYPLMAFIANEGVVPKGERYDRGALVKDAKNKNYKKTELGDFIYSSNNLETGSIGINNYGNASISPVYSIFRPTDLADSGFIGSRLVSKDVINSMVKWRQGVVYGQWKIHESDFLKIDIAVPALEEQRKIGSFLFDLDTHITCQQFKYVKYKSDIIPIFNRNDVRLSENTKFLHCNPSKVNLLTKKMKVHKILLFAHIVCKCSILLLDVKVDYCMNYVFSHQTWEQRKLGELGNTFTGLSGKTKNDFGHGNAKYITYINVFQNVIADYYGTETIEIDAKQNSVQYGDVLFTTSSETPNEVGMSTVWLYDENNVYLNSFCFGYRLNIKFDYYFFGYLLRTPTFRNKMELLAQGISRYNISKIKAMEIGVLFPNLEEQEKIGELFNKIDSHITYHQRDSPQ